MPKLFKKFIPDLSTKEGKLKAVIFASGTLLLLLIVTATALQLTSTPQFCRSCHEMMPEYVTWKASAHSQINCIDCHIEPGTDKFLVHKVESIKELYDHLTGRVYTPITMDVPIKDEVCERCHTSNRVVTPSGDIKIPHKVHKDNKVPCVKCHEAVAHARIGEEGFTADGNWDKWIEPVGKAYMRQDFLKFSMEECLNCHKEEDAGPQLKDCSACHTKLVKPESHKNPMFDRQHGLMAEADIKQCDKCHQKTMSITEPRIPVDDPVVKYARQNTFCAACHSTKKTPPPSHTVSWKRTHIVQATADRTGCLVCHDEGMPTSGSAATKTYCYRCHETNIHYDVIVRGKHIHGPPVNAQTELTRAPCFNCHSAQKCQRCHYVPDSKADLAKPEFRKPLSPGASITPESPGYGNGSPAGGSGSSSTGNYNPPPVETG